MSRSDPTRDSERRSCHPKGETSRATLSHTALYNSYGFSTASIVYIPSIYRSTTALATKVKPYDSFRTGRGFRENRVDRVVERCRDPVYCEINLGLFEKDKVKLAIGILDFNVHFSLTLYTLSTRQHDPHFITSITAK